MPRANNLYGPRTNREVARVVKNFNARRRYELKKALRSDPYAESYFPAKASVKKIKREINTRADLNKELASLNRFTAQKTDPVYLDKGVVMTKWELQEIKRDVETANKRRLKRVKEINPNTKAGTMGTIEQHNLRPIRFDEDKMTAAEIQRVKNLAKREAKKNFRSFMDQKYKDNYIQAVRENLGEYAQKVLDIVEPLSPQQMLNGYKTDPVLNIKFVSDPLKRAQIAEEVVQHWQEFLGISEPIDDSGDDWDEDLSEM